MTREMNFLCLGSNRKPEKVQRFPRDDDTDTSVHPQYTRRKRLGPDGCREDNLAAVCVRHYSGQTPEKAQAAMDAKVRKKRKPVEGEEAQVWFPGAKEHRKGTVVEVVKNRIHTFVFLNDEHGNLFVAPPWAVFRV